MMKNLMGVDVCTIKLEFFKGFSRTGRSMERESFDGKMGLVSKGSTKTT